MQSKYHYKLQVCKKKKVNYEIAFPYPVFILRCVLVLLEGVFSCTCVWSLSVSLSWEECCVGFFFSVLSLRWAHWNTSWQVTREQLRCTLQSIVHVSATVLETWTPFLKRYSLKLCFDVDCDEHNLTLQFKISWEVFEMCWSLVCTKTMAYEVHHLHIYTSIQWVPVLGKQGACPPGRTHSLHDQSIWYMYTLTCMHYSSQSYS